MNEAVVQGESRASSAIVNTPSLVRTTARGWASRSRGRIDAALPEPQPRGFDASELPPPQPARASARLAAANERAPERGDIRDVRQRLAARRAAGALDRRRAGVVGGEREAGCLEAVEHPPQVAGAGEH